MQDPSEVRRRKRRCNGAVLGGLLLMLLAGLVDSWRVAPLAATTFAGIAGFALVMYGVHLGWLVFYESESDGPPS